MASQLRSGTRCARNDSYLAGLSEREVLRVAYLPFVWAQRQKVDGSWEFIVTPFGQPYFLHLLPRAFNSSFMEVRWTKPYGLLIAGFEDGDYGGGEEDEIETVAMRKLGWPIANEPGTRILPGRDGWLRRSPGEDWIGEVPLNQRLPLVR
jgi:hypothetical protein